MEEILGLIPLLPVIVGAGGVIFGILDRQRYWIYVSLGIVLCMMISGMIKSLVPRIRGNLRPYITDPRPGVDPTCSLLNSAKGGEIGMPSAHATSMVFFVVMVYFYRGTVDWYVAFAAMLAALVITQRYWSECHSGMQLLAGSVLGLAIGVGMGMLVRASI